MYFSMSFPYTLIIHGPQGSGGSIAIFYLALLYMLAMVLLRYRARTIVATMYMLGFAMMITGDLYAWTVNHSGVFGAFGLADGDFLIPLWLAITSFIFATFSSGTVPYKPVRRMVRIIKDRIA